MTAWQAAHAKKMSARAAQVKTADKTANLRDLVDSPPDWPTERRRKYFDDARQVVQAMGQPHPVLSKLFETTFLSGLPKL
jgi:guanosine-3',5'-bis(diphosphate) 3'-pyrophosphohydrolase